MVYEDEVRVKIKGVWDPILGKFRHSIKSIDILDADYVSEGTIIYNIGERTIINSIDINDDYIIDEWKGSMPRPLQLLVTELDGTIRYNSDSMAWPIQDTITMPTGEKLLKLTLRKTHNVTPMIRYIDIV